LKDRVLSELETLRLLHRGIELLRTLTGQAKSADYVEWECDMFAAKAKRELLRAREER